MEIWNKQKRIDMEIWNKQKRIDMEIWTVINLLPQCTQQMDTESAESQWFI